MNPLKILIVEDEVLIAADLQELLTEMQHQVATAYDYAQAIIVANEFKPDVVFCDISLGDGLNGIAVAEELKKSLPDLAVVIISALVTEDIVQQAEVIKPFSYVVKPFNENQIRVTTRLLSNWLSAKSEETNKRASLSVTEQKILQYIAQQKSSKEIANELYISEKTVRNHRYNISKKLALPNTNNSLLKWAIANFVGG